MKDFWNKFVQYIKKYINKKNFNKIIKWCEANKRFLIALVLFAALLVLLKACTGPNDGQPEGQTTPEQTPGTDQQEPPAADAGSFELDGTFEKDAYPNVNRLIADYFTAYASADIAALEKIATPISDNEKSYIRVFSQYIESYENVSCYTKAGLTENSYLVSVYFDLKFYDVATTAPGLDFFYVETAEDGSVFINNLYSPYNLNRTENDLDPNIYAVILKFEQQEDSTQLRAEVETAYTQAVASDVDLATMLSATIPNAMTVWMDSITSSGVAGAGGDADGNGTTDGGNADGNGTTDGGDAAGGDADGNGTTDGGDAAGGNADGNGTTDGGDAAGGDADGNGTTDGGDAAGGDADGNGTTDGGANTVTKIKVTSKSVNVRDRASKSGNIIGRAKRNETYTKLGEEDGWTKIKYKGETGYIKSDYVSDVTE